MGDDVYRSQRIDDHVAGRKEGSEESSHPLFDVWYFDHYYPTTAKAASGSSSSSSFSSTVQRTPLVE